MAKAKRASREQLPGILRKAFSATVQVLQDEAGKVAEASKSHAANILDMTVSTASSVLKAGVDQLEKLQKKPEAEAQKPTEAAKTDADKK